MISLSFIYSRPDDSLVLKQSSAPTSSGTLEDDFKRRNLKSRFIHPSDPSTVGFLLFMILKLIIGISQIFKCV